MNNNVLKSTQFAIALALILALLSTLVDAISGIGLMVYPLAFWIFLARFMWAKEWTLTKDELRTFDAIVTNAPASSKVLLDVMTLRVNEFKPWLAAPQRALSQGLFITGMQVIKPLSLSIIVTAFFFHLNIDMIAKSLDYIGIVDNKPFTYLAHFSTLFALTLVVVISTKETMKHYRTAKYIKDMLLYRNKDKNESELLSLGNYSIDLSYFDRYINKEIEKEIILSMVDIIAPIEWDGKSYNRDCRKSLEQMKKWQLSTNQDVWLVSFIEPEHAGGLIIDRYAEFRNCPIRLWYAQKALVYAVLYSLDRIKSYQDFESIYSQLKDITLRNVFVYRNGPIIKQTVYHDGTIRQPRTLEEQHYSLLRYEIRTI